MLSKQEVEEMIKWRKEADEEMKRFVIMLPYSIKFWFSFLMSVRGKNRMFPHFIVNSNAAKETDETPDVARDENEGRQISLESFSVELRKTIFL